MILERYHQAIDDLFKKVRDTQTENINKAGELIANSIANGGCIFLSSICHSTEWDLINRGGGPAFYKHFSYRLNIEAGQRAREGKEDMTGEAERYALQQADMRPGDVLVVGSVSGRTLNVVHLAYEAVQMGINVIAFTSMEYATAVDPVHPSGKKLHEIATLVIDNCAPAAEAMMEIEGIEAKFGAASGIASDYILWCITAVVVEKLMEKGITPGILKSANFPGGIEYNKGINDNYKQFGW